MARPFAEIAAELRADPIHRAAIDREKAEMRRRYNRPHWKLVRFWERLTGRS